MMSMVLSLVVVTSSGGLLSERIPVAGMLVGAAELSEAPLVPVATVENMSLSELTAERARLVELRPGLGLGITLTSIGGVVFLIGLGTAVTYLVAGLIIMGTAVPLLVIGPILLARAIRERKEIQSQIKAIDRRLSNNKTAPSMSPDEVPPPPPVRPPDASLFPTVDAQFVLARF